METALDFATKPHDFKLLVQGGGRTGGSTMEDVNQEQAEDSDNGSAGDGRDPASLIPGL
jgi:hypothetical protein